MRCNALLEPNLITGGIALLFWGIVFAAIALNTP